MSDKLYHMTVAEAGNTIDDGWINAHMRLMESLPVYASFSWGWCVLMTDSRSLKAEIRARAQAAFISKPVGCGLCEEKEATMYHCYAGHVCPDCHATLPQE